MSCSCCSRLGQLWELRPTQSIRLWTSGSTRVVTLSDTARHLAHCLRSVGGRVGSPTQRSLRGWIVVVAQLDALCGRGAGHGAAKPRGLSGSRGDRCCLCVSSILHWYVASVWAHGKLFVCSKVWIPHPIGPLRQAGGPRWHQTSGAPPTTVRA